MPAAHLIFVYGTLKRGFCRAHLLTGQQFLGEARTQPLYRMFNCGTYPGLKLVPKDGLPIVGELWSVDSECLARLDREEGVAEGLYRRQLIDDGGRRAVEGAHRGQLLAEVCLVEHHGPM